MPLNFNREIFRLLVPAAAIFCASPLCAQSMGLDIKPGLEISRTQTNNFYNQNNNGSSASGLLISPSLTLSHNTGRARTTLGVSAEYANFNQSGNEDNYLDSTISSALSYKLGSRHQISINSAVNRNHDPFGTSRTQGGTFSNAELDKHVTGFGGMSYRFGAPTALLNFEIGGFGLEKTYTTNRFATSVLDYQTLGGSFTTFVNISPKTALLAETGLSSTRFDLLAGPTDFRNGNDTYYRAGVRWRAAAKTTGDFRVGQLEREIEATGQRAFRAASWTATVVWHPVHSATVTAQTHHATGESFLVNSPVIINRTHALSWGQSWTRKFKSTLSTSFIESEFVNIGRTDEITNATLALAYQTERIFGVIGSLNYNERQSDVITNNFDNLTANVGFSINFNLDTVSSMIDQ